MTSLRKCTTKSFITMCTLHIIMIIETFLLKFICARKYIVLTALIRAVTNKIKTKL